MDANLFAQQLLAFTKERRELRHRAMQPATKVEGRPKSSRAAYPVSRFPVKSTPLKTPCPSKALGCTLGDPFRLRVSLGP